MDSKTVFTQEQDEGKPLKIEKPFIRAYDDCAQYTEEGLILLDELESTIKPFLKKCFEKRIHPADIKIMFASATEEDICNYYLNEVFR